YGLRSVYLEYKVQHGRDDLVGSPLQRANLKLPAGYEKGLPQLSGVLATSDVNGNDPLAHKPKRVDVTATWPLKNQFKVGDLVWLEVCGDDYCDVYGYRPPGRGVPQIVLKIVSKRELDKVVDDKLKQVQQDVKNVKELQEKAHDMIK